MMLQLEHRSSEDHDQVKTVENVQVEETSCDLCPLIGLGWHLRQDRAIGRGSPLELLGLRWHFLLNLVTALCGPCIV